MRLQCQKLKVQEHQILVEASHCKTANATGLPVGKLSWTLMPAIFDFVKEYIMFRIETGEKLLFTIPQEGALAPWFNTQLAQLFTSLCIDTGGQTSYSFRRGTTSVLLKCKLP